MNVRPVKRAHRLWTSCVLVLALSLVGPAPAAAGVDPAASTYYDAVMALKKRVQSRQSLCGNQVASSSDACSFEQELSPDDLAVALLGFSFLGSGGGGAFNDGWSVLGTISGNVTLSPIDLADPDKVYVVTGGIGAPSAVKAEVPALVVAAAKSATKLAELTQRPLGGVLSVESGAVNSLLAAAISRTLKVPVMDADGAGRSVPTLANVTYDHEAGVTVAPVVLTSMKGEQVVLEPKTSAEAEQQIRDTISKPGWGNVAGIALWAQDGATLRKSSVIRSAYTTAHALGQSVLDSVTDPNLASFLERMGQLKKTAFYHAAKLETFEQKQIKGFDEIILTSNAWQRCDSSGCQPEPSTLTISALNENLLMSKRHDNAVEEQVVATAPHGIGFMVDVSTDPNVAAWLPINNGDVAIMRSVAERKGRIVPITFYAPDRLYDFSDTFLDILKKVFEYQGDVVPPRPRSGGG